MKMSATDLFFPPAGHTSVNDDIPPLTGWYDLIQFKLSSEWLEVMSWQQSTDSDNKSSQQQGKGKQNQHRVNKVHAMVELKSSMLARYLK